MSKEDTDRRFEEEQKRAAKEKAEHEDKQRQKQSQSGAAGKSPYGDVPKVGSTDPGNTTMANPAPQNVPIDPIEPTDDPMATPPAGPLPNPPSQPGGDLAGEPNVSATGEKLSPDHPDYRKDMEGRHGPDHRSAEEKAAHPLDDKGQAGNTPQSGG